MKKTLLLISLLLTFLTSAQESYYNDIDLTAGGLTLKENLAIKTINAHTNFLDYTWEASRITDLDPNNSNNVLLIYGWENGSDGDVTNDLSRSKNNNGGNQGDWNREHTFANSLANPKLDNSGKDGTSFSDAHNLRASDLQRNGLRGNRLFADGAGNSGAVGSNWYPGDATAGGTDWRGDAARVTMYMYLRYGSQCLPRYNASGNTNSIDADMIDLLLDWNAADPVSPYEEARNTYHETTSTYAQGNRNPFIDNPYLATRIWGGTPAEDRWGIYTSNDNEAPTVPTNVALSNPTTSTIDASWTASEDNEAVSKYEVYANGTLNGETTITNYTLTGLNSNTSYAVAILAKDIANNKSGQSTAVNGTTLTDNEAPTVPTNITISNQTGTSFRVNWTASTDNSTVTAYEVFIDGTPTGSASNTSYDVTGLNISTDYSVNVLAKDSTGNTSAQSATVTATTSNGMSDVSELFFSEYVEGSGYNKALEIVNLTSNNIDLAPYTIKRQSIGVWESPLQLIGTIAINNVFVIINSSTTNVTLLEEKDQEVANSTPMTFNGDDRVGLFKNDVLIDIIGELDGIDMFAENTTLRRNNDITEPNTVYSEQGEWSYFPSNTVSDIGNYNGTLSVKDNSLLTPLKIYPNPTNGNTLYFNVTKKVTVKMYNVLGKLIKTDKVTVQNNSLDIGALAKGIYILKMKSENQFITKKIIKN
jgi:endonuclease I/chitodextrinase